jgi:hypothetical protein
MSSTCGHSSFIFLPPTLAFLVENVHAITPNQDIDRSVPRCKFCDLLAAQERANQADKPPPTHESLVDKLDRDIKLTQDLISEGIRKDELEKALEVMKKQLDDAVMATDLRIAGAWKEYWAVWGHGEGPDRANEYYEGDGDDDIAGSVEDAATMGVADAVATVEAAESVEAVVEKKPKPAPKKKGGPSRKK